MGEAEDRILDMLSEGTITAEEAEELLAVLGSDDLEKPTSAGVIEGVEVQDAKPHSAPPDLSRFRRWWRIPLFIAAISAVISGAGLPDRCLWFYVHLERLHHCSLHNCHSSNYQPFYLVLHKC